MKAASRSGDQGTVGASSARAPALEAPGLDIEALFAEHAPFIAAVIQRVSGPGAHIDDLVQETFLVAFRNRDRFDGRSQARTWLYGIAIRLCSRRGRSLRRLAGFLRRLSAEPALEESARPDGELDRAEKRAVVHAALQRLSLRHREVFVLYELEELEGAEIADLLGVPIGTVWTRLHHARRRFRKLMRATGEMS